jgi:hypothetical protein
VNLLRCAGREVTCSTWVERNEVHERSALTRKRGELRRVLSRVVDTAEHHILERYSPVKHLPGLDHAGERILGIDGHQRLTQLVIRRVNGYRQPELFGSLSESDNPRQNADRGNRDVPSSDTQTSR